MLRSIVNLSLGLAFFNAAPALSHPHIWIESHYQVDMSSTTIQKVDAKWQFDVFSSVDMLIEFDQNADGVIDDSEKPHALELMTNLAQFDYFVRVQVDGKDLKPQTIQPVDVGIKDEALTVTLAVTLPAPVDLNQSTLRLGFGDPENYFAMVIPDAGLMALQGAKAESCTPAEVDAKEFYMEGWVDLHCQP